jgi:hypothetical protein
MISASPASAQAQQSHGRLDDPFLDNLVGTWSISRQIRGTVVENVMQAQWVLNHQFIQLHMRGAGDPPSYEALVLIGYDPSASRHVAHWCDDFGGQYSAVGYGKRSGNAIEFTFTYPDGPFHNTFTWDPSTRGWTFLMQSEDSKGQRRLFGVDTARRK